MPDSLTKHQFLTVWDEAVGRPGYSKRLFQEMLDALTAKGLIKEFRLMPEFDLHAAIKRLAGAERLRKSLPDFASDPPGSVGTQSMELPFASLRLECDSEWCNVGYDTLNDCVLCAGRGWVPEPDVEKACWRVFWLLPAKVRSAICLSSAIHSWEETVLCVAEEWVKERHAAP